MKKILSMPMMLAICSTLLVSSCKKDHPASATGSGNLDAGKSSISFDNTGSFAGSSSFSLSNSVTNAALSNANGSIRNVSLSASEITGVNSRSVTLTIIVPPDATTTSGNITGDFAEQNGTVYPALTLSSTNGTSPGTAYVSESGTCTITKLTSSEIEGTFSAVVKNDDGTQSLTISNGKFSGKF
ncbi:MAG: hypothetical protein ABI402_07270 [Ferruginibacter sp.]